MFIYARRRVNFMDNKSLGRAVSRFVQVAGNELPCPARRNNRQCGKAIVHYNYNNKSAITNTHLSAESRPLSQLS
jgi:hypothetical protein